MNILEVSQILGVSITIKNTISDDVERKWSATIDDLEVKDGCLIGSATGFGPTPDDALANLCEMVSGATIVLNREGSRLTAKLPTVVSGL